MRGKSFANALSVDFYSHTKAESWVWMLLLVCCGVFMPIDGTICLDILKSIGCQYTLFLFL